MLTSKGSDNINDNDKVVVVNAIILLPLSFDSCCFIEKKNHLGLFSFTHTNTHFDTRNVNKHININGQVILLLMQKNTLYCMPMQ